MAFSRSWTVGRTRVLGRGIGAELGDAGTVKAGMGAGEEEGDAQAGGGNTVAVSFGGSLDHAVQAESSQIIGHSALGDGGGR